MQTFLPHTSFARSAEVLDQARLGKQRVEVLQVLRALELPDYGWANHPAVVMWRGRTPALVGYGLACVRAWTALGHADSTAPLITEFAPCTAGLDQDALGRAGLLPGWLGDPALHLSHRSALVRKDPARYGPLFGEVPDDLPYVWPGADPGAAAPAPLPAGADAAGGPEGPGGTTARRLWVVRAPDAAALGAFVAEGFVGLDASSGVEGDALATHDHSGSTGSTGGDGGARGGPSPARRRGGKAARQLRAFLDDVVPGDDVAVLAGGERALLVGRVTGDYAHRAVPGAAVHQRTVVWDGVLPRSAVARPHLLQDPRALFRVPLAAPSRAGSGGPASAGS